jgi:uncharacterized protein involved in exopolysaccharide biosynthesis
MKILGSSGLNVGLYLYQARRWTFFALLPAVAVAGGAYAFTKHQPKTYQASAVLYVQQAQNTPSLGVSGGTDPSASSQLAQTYSQMITDPTIQTVVRTQMIDKYHRPATWSVQSDQRNATQQSTQLFGVSVTDTMPRRAADVANAYARVFIQRISKLERARYSADELRLKRQVNGASAQIKKLTVQVESYHGPSSGLDALRTSLGAYESTYQSLLSSLASFQASRDANTNSVSVYSSAAVPPSPSGPNSVRNGLLFGFVALLLCVGLAFLYDYVNDLPRTSEDV